jgi:negative regulator of flagellin synthesis FlgM
MSNVLEDIAMVNQIHDSTRIKTMEIDSHFRTNNREKKEEVAAEPTVSNNKVNLSNVSRQLEAIQASFKDIAEVDPMKVAHFKAEIEAGNYQIYSTHIAEKMVHNSELV